MYAICDPAKESLECGIVEVLFWPPGKAQMQATGSVQGFLEPGGDLDRAEKDGRQG